MKLTFGRDVMFALELKLEGFFCKDASGRKTYTKGRVLKWNVEYGSLTLDLLLKHLSIELNLCTDQTPTIWFYDKRLNKDTRLANEIQMIDLFEMYKEEMTCQVVVGVFDRSTCLDHEFDELEPICVIPPAAVDAPDDAADLDNHDANIPNEPTRGPSQPKAGPSVAQENLEAECDREPDIFDNAEECGN